MKGSSKMSNQIAKPVLKWAGGKTQMLGDLLPKVPKSYRKYIEPFFGGGAMFFALQPEHAMIADSNPELINMYRQIAVNVDDVISYLKKYKNTSEMFYTVREQEWTSLPGSEAAARTIFLNKTCFNGLYRVNKQGKFNVPYGRYTNPRICDEDGLKAASMALQKAEILCEDYLAVLEHYAQTGDFVFLDPPYLPVSEYADFKRYTKEQFYEEDHIKLAKMILRLQERGCYIVLTNSNHPLVHELYAPFMIDVIQTKRHISCNRSTRRGEDVIVTVLPERQILEHPEPRALPQQVSAYPPTRFMGSKSKLLSEIWSVVSGFHVDTVVDLFSGSGVVGY
ncbi:MAG: Dam family site-specific DNA-(adenine-N6)-methyltransferase, partial [Roseburia sp.]|nr:Dam family site-specific DNA-(adenine-N6)-methyltransferase [Roseburia sp.]